MTPTKPAKKKARARASAAAKAANPEPRPAPKNAVTTEARPRPRARRATRSEPPANYAKQQGPNVVDGREQEAPVDHGRHASLGVEVSASEQPSARPGVSEESAPPASSADVLDLDAPSVALLEAELEVLRVQAALPAAIAELAAGASELKLPQAPPTPHGLGLEGGVPLARTDEATESSSALAEETRSRAVPGSRPLAPPRASMFAPAPDDDSGSVLITGICGRLGKLLVRELHRETRVVGIDRRSFPDAPKDVVLHRFDVRRKKTRDVFRHGRVRAVVHLGIMHDPRSNHRVRHSWNVVAFQKLLEYMAQYRVRKLVVLSSANVYGPNPDNPQFLTEEAPLLGSQEFFAIRDLVELDMLAQGNFWKNPDVETVILRPCHILGEVRNAPSNYLRLENPVTILGFDPMIQVLHERDVVRAIRLALEPGVRGIFNLRGQGELPLSRILELAGRNPTKVPAPLAKLAIEQFFRFRLGSFPAPEIDHIRYLCMVDDSRAREVLGWAPRYSLEDAIRAALEAA